MRRPFSSALAFNAGLELLEAAFEQSSDTTGRLLLSFNEDLDALSLTAQKFTINGTDIAGIHENAPRTLSAPDQMQLFYRFNDGQFPSGLTLDYDPSPGYVVSTTGDQLAPQAAFPIV